MALEQISEPLNCPMAHLKNKQNMLFVVQITRAGWMHDSEYE